MTDVNYVALDGDLTVSKGQKKQTKKLAKKQVNKITPIASKNLKDGAVNGLKLGPIEQVTDTGTIGATAGDTGSATATCPEDTKVVGWWREHGL